MYSEEKIEGFSFTVAQCEGLVLVRPGQLVAASF